MPLWYAFHQPLANSILFLLRGGRWLSMSLLQYQRVTKCSLLDLNPFPRSKILDTNLLSCNRFQLSSLWMNPQRVSKVVQAFKDVNEALLCYHSTESIWVAFSHQPVKRSSLVTVGGKGLKLVIIIYQKSVFEMKQPPFMPDYPCYPVA